MARRIIGESIGDAIDWAQDTLRTTRPLAERVLFAMLAEKEIVEMDQGFLVEASDEEDEGVIMRKHHERVRATKPRFRFHETRQSKVSQSKLPQSKTQRKKIGWTDPAGDMIQDDEESG